MDKSDFGHQCLNILRQFENLKRRNSTISLGIQPVCKLPDRQGTTIINVMKDNWDKYRWNYKHPEKGLSEPAENTDILI